MRTVEVREQVLDRAIELLERDGPPAVTARRVAELAGTSTAALYEFFGDKAGLLRAVALEGFAALRGTLEAVEAGSDAHRYLVDLLAAARRFAVGRPMLFEVMYSRPLAEFGPGEQDAEAGAAVYRLVVRAVRDWLRQAGSSADAREAAHIIVAAHRGFVMSELHGLAGSSPRTVEARYGRGVEAVLAGLLRPRGKR